MDAETIKVAILGLVQGITEILPVSSSGHLVLGKHLLKLESHGALLEAVLHGGTLVAIIVYYRARLAELIAGFFRNEGTARRDVGALLAGMIPAGLVGVLFNDPIEESFDSSLLVGYCLLFTGVLLLLPRILKPAVRSSRVTFPQALVVGFAQIISLLPGVSRSGTTITAGRLAGVEGRESARFSFLMAIPLLGGALGLTILKALKAGAQPLEVPVHDLAIGFAVAGLAGYVAISLLNRLLGSNRLWLFGPYCLAVGLTAILLSR